MQLRLSLTTIIATVIALAVFDIALISNTLYHQHTMQQHAPIAIRGTYAGLFPVDDDGDDD